MERSRDAYSRGFLSTLSLRRATSNLASDPPTIGISIHALLAESDPKPSRICLNAWCISIHALLAESDYGTPSTNFQSHSFLSTLSLRRATKGKITMSMKAIFLSTLSLRRATYQRQIDQKSRSISIHALLAESDETQQNGQ